MPSLKLRRAKEPKTSIEEFYQAALELFSQKGFYLTSVDDIVKKAGRSKGGFYHHFKSKSALLRGLFKSMMREFGTLLLDDVKKGVSLEQAFKNYINSLPVKAVINSTYLKAIAELYAMALRDRGTREMLLDFHAEAIGLFEKVLKIGQARGEVEFPENPRELAEIMYTELRGSMLINIILHQGVDLQRLFKSYVQRTLRALKKK